MNPKYFGDSYDIVKRFFCAELLELGYSVVVQPMFTGEWQATKEAYFRFVRASPPEASPTRSGRTALFVDPDTGVHRKKSKQHVSFDELAEQALKYELVFSFDQSFSRQQNAGLSMQEKLSALQQRSCHAMYYDSHARFLFVATSEQRLSELRSHLVSLGMPASRFVTRGT